MTHCWVQALEDEEYYTDRPPGEIVEQDDPSAKLQ